MAKMAPTASTPPTTPSNTDWSCELEAGITDMFISDVKPVVKVCCWCTCVHCIYIPVLSQVNEIGHIRTSYLSCMAMISIIKVHNALTEVFVGCVEFFVTSRLRFSQFTLAMLLLLQL